MENQLDLTGWQPIETAPKDGTEIDVWAVTTDEWGRPVNASRYPDASWREGDEGTGWHALHDVWDHFLIDDSWSGGKTIVTHWMPKPAPPA
ncbi:hypothetical protein EN788_22175 [Mesorhizobium sp. M2D.F.Ca.ET.145.01.1.1]|uniref:hypothetical protein n=1 Tax=unclassified Mesorhizobium TaxID=325217 RepID=UPI000FC9E4B2|nr:MULTISPECIES: hypothetical protein [unclassified Mesorhizobium]TGU44626.1 hypothetical protein EN789_21725 [bacterium M00.F.Ca.ET.146.01.1.1]TGU58454.1 hypothetical protein EN791_021725 [Mesorhizobium sp. M2D.F.Ca.ET.148.01.1.1]TGU64386.1 hypothetical protein EN790_21720 [Mesorhizobium sp. M2D.F.Ca.ET.147.01.1.1]TGW09962.1 hypothetical protein EN788_22175 [Mesorhizobium sp. M2D.F.Ca.ET.145.01.1.1]